MTPHVTCVCVSVCGHRQLDLRAKHRCRPGGGGGSVLVNLQTQCGPGSEAKCVSVCPSRPDLLAVGANDPYVRVYDRRMVRLGGLSAAAGPSSPGTSAAVPPTTPDGAVQYFCPGQTGSGGTTGFAFVLWHSAGSCYHSPYAEGSMQTQCSLCCLLPGKHCWAERPWHGGSTLDIV